MKKYFKKSNSVMEPRDHFKNGASLKSQMSKVIILLLFLLTCVNSFGQLRKLTQAEQQKFSKWYKSHNKGERLYYDKRYDEAIKELISATKRKTPDNVNRAWYVMGLCYHELSKYDDAIRSYNTYLQQAAQRGKCPQCVEFNKKYSCMSQRDFFYVHFFLAKCYIAKGENESALTVINTAINAKAAFGSAISDKTINGRTIKIRGDLYAKQGKMDEAINDYKIVLNDKDFEAAEKEKLVIWLINHYESTNNYKELYDIISQRVPKKNAEQYNKLAYASFKIDKLEEADKYYNEALKIEPSLSVNKSARNASKKFVEEKREKEEQERIEREQLKELQKKAEEKQRQEAEIRRVAAIKSAEIGDKLYYSDTWNWKETFLWSVTSGSYTMYVTCFIERIEGERYQLRVGDVTSSNSQRSSTPTINGVKVSKGDIIWARPLNDSKWVYGE